MKEWWIYSENGYPSEVLWEEPSANKKYKFLNVVMKSDYIELEHKILRLRNALEKIQDWTVEDPAEGPELRARAACVYNETIRALVKENK